MNEPRSFRAEAVVLRHSDWGEADRLLTIFAREQGKFRVLAKGARRIRSRKAGHLEPFTRITIQLARTRDIPLITQVETVDAYLPVREDLERTAFAAYIIELLDKFTYEGETSQPALYRLLTDTLSRIAEQPDPWLSVRYYEMRLLDFLGFRPHLFQCANCERDIQPEDQYFSASMGGVICLRCGLGLPGLWPVAMDTLKYLRHFQRSTFHETLKARPSSQAQRELEALTQAYFSYLLERELNTPGFLKQVRR